VANRNIDVKDFLIDLRSGMAFVDLRSKYGITEERLSHLCRQLLRPDLVALQSLWEKEKLTQSQFMRAFSELEETLNEKDRS
jgi:hypothetical protein